MQSTFPAMMNQAERNDLAGTPMVIQQYARYPTSIEPGLQSGSSIGSAHSQLANSKSPPLHRYHPTFESHHRSRSLSMFRPVLSGKRLHHTSHVTPSLLQATQSAAEEPRLTGVKPISLMILLPCSCAPTKAATLTYTTIPRQGIKDGGRFITWVLLPA